MDKTRIIIVAAIAIMFLLALTVIFFVFHYSSKQLKMQLAQQEEMERVRAELQKQMLENSLELQETVRKAIAKDLHDEIGGLLSATKMSLFAVAKKLNIDNEQFITSQSLVAEALSQVRNLSRELVPQTLENFGLKAALEELCEKMNRATAINFSCKMEGLDEKGSLPHIKALGIYRILQELTNNAIKHSNASEIAFLLNKVDNKIHVEFKENGVGYEFEKLLGDNTKGLGLTNIVSRLSVLGAEREFNSVHNKGSSFKFTFEQNV
ncbi:Histidine kinase [Spirosomataceae bacterium TFI 002]|nr:Histidine kinase [Spirosomataceae bacterium TFI 002]